MVNQGYDIISKEPFVWQLLRSQYHQTYFMSIFNIPDFPPRWITRRLRTPQNSVRTSRGPCFSGPSASSPHSSLSQIFNTDPRTAISELQKYYFLFAQDLVADDIREAVSRYLS